LDKQRKDRRIQRTRENLQNALISLLFKRNYDVILVQDILDRANVGRSTFYAHFRDKDELLLSTTHNLHEMLRQAQSNTLPPSAKPYERIISFSYAMFEHSRDFQPLYKSLVQSQAGTLIMQSLRKMIADLVMEESKKEFQRRRKPNSVVPLEILIHHVASAFISVLTWWLDHNSSLSPKAINAIFRALVLPTLAAHFD
jgi:AcrR family transcriptional regulator